MAIDVDLEKLEKAKDGNGILILLILILVILFGLYFFLFSYVLPQREEEATKLKAEFSELSQKVTSENNGDLSSAQNYINDFKVLLENSPKTSKFFGRFEEWAHPLIVYSNLKFETNLRKVSMSGKTSNNRSLMEQITVLNNEESIESYELSNININGGGDVSFEISLIIRETSLR